MSLKKEGSIVFFAKHDHPDWTTNANAYNFPEMKHGSIHVTSKKEPDGTFKVSVAGPFGQQFDFAVKPIPETDARGLHVGVTWKENLVTLYLNGEVAGTVRAEKKKPF